jgi:hypothetical protein
MTCQYMIGGLHGASLQPAFTDFFSVAQHIHSSVQKKSTYTLRVFF